MSSPTEHPADQQPVAEPLSIRQIAELLVKQYGLTDGLYDPMIEFSIGTAYAGANEDDTLPSAIVGVSRIGLIRTQKKTALTVDAAQINKPKRRRKVD
ncbi:hypothetical protein [Rhodocyclus purpureus]|uniref:hypothetical protein n=1 Tax=Rhodocyclus purpureus TaxID=1067 RepID=UPI001911E369|nr:hypothetical protein [Rhodocyclus purpureus]MBK5912802.1 hypothetical protein [Rhodocyclus purpureus]